MPYEKVIGLLLLALAIGGGLGWMFKRTPQNNPRNDPK